MEQEIWKNIPNFDKYEASNIGNIRNKQNKRNLSIKVNRSGYIKICAINNNNKRISTSIHRLVCMAFHGEKSGENYSVDHIDRNKTNNNELNLRWVNASDQNKNKEKKISWGGFPIEMVDIETNEIMATFKNSAFAAKLLNLRDRHCVLKNLNNKDKLIENCYFKNQYVDVDFDDEQWKQIGENFWISSYGRIKDKNNKPLNITPCNKYFVCTLNGKIKRLHRLVATHFIPNPNNYEIVNHKDNNGQNNHIDNLEWCTHQQNMIHAQQFKKSPIYTWIRVYKFDMDKKLLLKTYNTVKEAADEENISQSSMSKRIITRVNLNGIMWSYTNEIPEITETKEKPIYKFDESLNLIKVYDTITEAAIGENITPSSMRRITKKNSKIGNFIFSREKNIIQDQVVFKDKINSRKIIEKVDNNTKEIIEIYNSNLECAKANDLSPNTVKYRIQNKVIKNNILYRYTQ